MDQEKWFDEFLDAIDKANVQVLLWFCPVKEHGQGTRRPTVVWRNGIAHCAECPRTSANTISHPSAAR